MKLRYMIPAAVVSVIGLFVARDALDANAARKAARTQLNASEADLEQASVSGFGLQIKGMRANVRVEFSDAVHNEKKIECVKEGYGAAFSCVRTTVVPETRHSLTDYKLKETVTGACNSATLAKKNGVLTLSLPKGCTVGK